MDFEEKYVSRVSVFEGRIFKTVVDDIKLPDGNDSKREVVLHNGAVCIAPITEDNRLVFVRQYRYPMKEVLTELPAGRIEPNEEPVNTAHRELIEEAGLLVGECLDLGVSYPTPGYSTEKIYLFAARINGECLPQPDEGEFVEKITISLEDAVKMVYDGEICDSKTAVLILKVEKAVKDGLI